MFVGGGGDLPPFLILRFMAEVTSLSGLSTALDDYMERIEKVRLSSGVLQEQHDAVIALSQAIDMLTLKLTALSAAGSPRATLISGLQSALLSGQDFTGLLRQEGRAAAMRPDGVPGLNLGDAQLLRQAAGASPMLQSASSLRMLSALAEWSSFKGSAPTAGGMAPALESRMAALGTGLTSEQAQSPSLVKDIEEDTINSELLESAEDIQEGTDAVLSALDQKQDTVVGTLESEKKEVAAAQERSRSSWWSTLKTVGLVLGTATGVFGLLGSPSVQRFIQENLLSAEGRQALWGKFESVLNLLGEKVSSVLALGERINAGLLEVKNLVGASGEGTAQRVSAAGSAVYAGLSAEDQQGVQAFQRGYEQTLSSPAPLPAGITDAETSALSTGMKASAMLGAGLFGGVKTAGAAYKTLRTLYRGAQGMQAASRASYLLNGFTKYLNMSRFAVWGILATGLITSAARQKFNKASLLAAYEEGSPVFLAYPAYGGNTPQLLDVGSLQVSQDDGSTTALYNTMTAEEQLGYSTSLMGALGSYTQEQNALALQAGIVDMGDYITTDSGEVVSSSDVSNLKGEELSKFLSDNPALAASGLLHSRIAGGDAASELLVGRDSDKPFYLLTPNDPFISGLPDDIRSSVLQQLRDGRFRAARPRDIISYNRMSSMLEANTQGNFVGGLVTQSANKLLTGVGIGEWAARQDAGFKGSSYANTLEGLTDVSDIMPSVDSSAVRPVQPSGAVGAGTVLRERDSEESAGARAPRMTFNSANTTAPTYIYQIGSNSQEEADR